MPKKSNRSLEDIVGKETYEVWVDMLRELVPSGRTHRLCVVVAGMLQYALEKAMLIKNINKEEHSLAMSLIDASDTSDTEQIAELIHDAVHRLFKDAGVKYERVSKGGEEYSVIHEAYREFSCWFEYPWDSW
jgi:signal-transduction protein with cAMP-binding, CBS, and nucleotidyltransferase domain